MAEDLPDDELAVHIHAREELVVTQILRGRAEGQRAHEGAHRELLHDALARHVPDGHGAALSSEREHLVSF